jgi:hypothetical protein
MALSKYLQFQGEREERIQSQNVGTHLVLIVHYSDFGFQLGGRTGDLGLHKQKL